MGERRPVEMVRLEEPEEVYEVEAVLGRDATSVFPNMNKDEDPMEALKASIGAKRFVSESELEEIKKARGLSVDDGTAAPDRPLAEILAERKKAKQDAFEEQWRQMKTGKNRPLEPDELEFLEQLARREAEEAARIQSQEQADLEAYRQAVAAAAAARGAAAGEQEGQEEQQPPAGVAGSRREQDAAAGGGGLGGNSSSGGGAVQQAARRAVGVSASSKPLLASLKPVVKVRPKAGVSSSEARALPVPNECKRPRLEHESVQQHQIGVGEESSPGQLASLLGGYASGSDSD